MKGQNGHHSQVATVASGANDSTTVYIAGANRILIELPAFGTLLAASTSAVYVKVAKEATDTFRRLQDMGVYSANSGIYDWEIPTGSGNRFVLCRPVVGVDHMKVELGQTATAGYCPTVHILY